MTAWLVSLAVCTAVAFAALFGLDALGVFTAIGSAWSGALGVVLGVMALIASFWMADAR